MSTFYGRSGGFIRIIEENGTESASWLHVKRGSPKGVQRRLCKVCPKHSTSKASITLITHPRSHIGLVSVPNMSLTMGLNVGEENVGFGRPVGFSGHSRRACFYHRRRSDNDPEPYGVREAKISSSESSSTSFGFVASEDLASLLPSSRCDGGIIAPRTDVKTQWQCASRPNKVPPRDISSTVVSIDTTKAVDAPRVRQSSWSS